MHEDIDDRLVDLRALWQSDATELPRLSRVELDRKVWRLGIRIRIGAYVGWAVCAFEIVAFGSFFFQPGDFLRKLGALLTVAGMTFLAIQIRFYFVQMRRYHEAMVIEPSVVFYRASLEHLRSFSRGWWFWSRFLALLPGPLLMSFDQGHRAARGLGGYKGLFAFIIIFAIAILLNVVVAVRLLNTRLAVLESFARDG